MKLLNKLFILGVKLYLQENKRISLHIVGKKFQAWNGTIGNRMSEGRPRNFNSNVTYFSVQNQTPLINSNAPILTSLNQNSILKFGTNLNHDVLPYLDGRNIDFDYPAPLSGIEFFYYYTQGYGGFIRPRITTINYYDAILNIVEQIDSQGPNFHPIKSGFKNNLELIYLETKLP